jgi:hypothetical protein
MNTKITAFVRDCDTGSLRRLLSLGDTHLGEELRIEVLTEIHRRDVLAADARARVRTQPEQTIKAPRP